MDCSYCYKELKSGKPTKYMKIGKATVVGCKKCWPILLELKKSYKE